MKFCVKIASVLLSLLLGNEIITTVLILIGLCAMLSKLFPAAAERW